MCLKLYWIWGCSVSMLALTVFGALMAPTPFCRAAVIFLAIIIGAYTVVLSAVFAAVLAHKLINED